jgi:hypothetical protein
MENVGVFYDHLEYFTAIWYNLWPFVAFWYIFSFLDPEKSGNPGPEFHCHKANATNEGDQLIFYISR